DAARLELGARLPHLALEPGHAGAQVLELTPVALAEHREEHDQRAEDRESEEHLGGLLPAPSSVRTRRVKVARGASGRPDAGERNPKRPSPRRPAAPTSGTAADR